MTARAERLEGKIVVVTGGASGIGRAAAIACAREGASVIIADLAAPAGNDVASQIRHAGGNAACVACDVTRSEEVAALFQRVVADFGRIDGAFNNAGIEGRLGATADVTEELFERVLDVNVLGVWRCLREELALMTRSGGGAIVNAASVAGLVGAGGLSPYVASKHAVVGLTKAAAIEYAKAGIRVNAVCPGAISTPMLDRLVRDSPGISEELVARKPMGRLGTAEEVAEAVVWLLSDAASFVTGHALAVDGGYVAQ